MLLPLPVSIGCAATQASMFSGLESVTRLYLVGVGRFRGGEALSDKDTGHVCVAVCVRGGYGIAVRKEKKQLYIERNGTALLEASANVVVARQLALSMVIVKMRVLITTSAAATPSRFRIIRALSILYFSIISGT